MTESFLGSVAEELKRAVEPLAMTFGSVEGVRRLLRRFGWTADTFDIGPAVAATADPDAPFDDTVDEQEILDSIEAALGLDPLMTSLDSAAETLATSADESEAASALGAVAGNLIRTVAEFADLASDPPDLPYPLDQPDFWAEVPPLLPDEFFCVYLEDRWTPVYGTLVLLGVIELSTVTPVGHTRVPYIARRIHWERMAELFTDPKRVSREVYHWDDPTAPFDAERLLSTLQIFLWSVSFAARRESQPSRLRVPLLTAGSPGEDAFLEAGIAIRPVGPSTAPQTTPVGLGLSPIVSGALQTGDGGADGAVGWSLGIAGEFSTDDAFSLSFRPKDVSFDVGGPASFSASVQLEGRANPFWLVVGAPKSHRLEVEGLHVMLGVRGTTADPEVRFELGTGSGATPGKVRFVLQFTDGDGFLQKIFGTEPQIAESALTLRWSSKSGFTFVGEVGLTFRIPIHLSLGGVIVIDILTIGVSGTVGADGKPAAALTLAISASLKLGPVSGSVDQVGARLLAVPAPPGTTGTFGNLDLKLAFKPPAGAGLAIKGGPVTGGGYVSFDETIEQYAGILELSFKTISITVIGLLTTRLPDASGAPGATKKGFSLLLIIAIELPPIQLGYGFTLNGVGGLFGVNRTMMVDPLRNGVRDGTVNSILFPQNVIARAPQIISQLTAIFPPAEGRFVFGPMVKLGWGPNAIIEVSVALVLELMSPIRLVILGRVQVALPDKKSTILNLRLDVVGVVDFDKGEISVDASLVDSRLVVFVITGDMAVRIGWGATKIFAIAAGGFHPNFLPPPGFPSLRRLAISLGDGDNPRLRLECYMALTANTIQFGAALDAYLRMDTFVGTIAISAFVHFDALIQFQPLEMTAALGAQIEITRDGAPFLLAALSATLTGPTPWHVVGYAEFNFLGKHRVDVEINSGPAAPAPIVTMNPGDVLGEIAKAFARPDAWVALPPGDAERIVSIRDQAPGGPGVVVHPLGALSTRQRVLPLGTAIDRFGAAVVPATTFRLDGFRVGSGATEPPEAELYDDFSPGQFKVLNDDERVARPVFESMRSGGRVKISSFRLPDDVPQGLPTTSAYDEWTVDVEPETGARVDKARSGAGATLPTHVTDALVATGAAAQAETRQTGAPQFRGPTLAVTIRPERYLLAEVDSCEPVWGARAISSAEAHDLLAVRGGAGMPVQVVPASEAAA